MWFLVIKRDKFQKANQSVRDHVSKLEHQIYHLQSEGEDVQQMEAEVEESLGIIRENGSISVSNILIWSLSVIWYLLVFYAHFKVIHAGRRNYTAQVLVEIIFSFIAIIWQFWAPISAGIYMKLLLKLLSTKSWHHSKLYLLFFFWHIIFLNY